ncbi:hypothetical protein [Chitinophaga niastensis]|nr:hypothetical protein [Chitinophaga niastensis]
MKICSVYTILLAICLFAGMSMQANAQTNDSIANKGRWGVEGRAGKITDKISHRLNLNKVQYDKIYEINEDIIRRRDAVRADTGLPKKKHMQEMKALDTERSQRFKTVLTAAQYKRWNDWEMNKKEHLEEKMEKKRQKKEAKDSTQQ